MQEMLSGSDSPSTDTTLVGVARTLKLSTSIKRKFKELGRPKEREGGVVNRDDLRTRSRAKSLSTTTTPMPTPTPALHSSDLQLPSPLLTATTTESVGPVTSVAGAATSRQLSAPILSRPLLPMNEEGDVAVPKLLQEGIPMTKVSSKKQRRSVFRLDPDIGQIIWEGKRQRIIPIENIKELRSGPDARYYREQFQLAAEYEDRWLTIVYILDGAYKTLHLIAASRDDFRMWDTTLRRLYAIRQKLMSGLGNLEMRQAIWEKHYWKGADEEHVQKLVFDEVAKLCRRLNINSSPSELQRLFKQADVQRRNYLDFEDFRHFVKLLKARPEIDRLYNKLRARGGGVFDFAVFERFMRDKQENLFERHSGVIQSPSTSGSVTPSHPTRAMSKEAFTAFLMSPDNAAFTDQHGRVCHDMTRPLSDYYVSSSHNTYLVGHQLVVDIFDGDNPSEPHITHGKTLTSKVSLREVCHAIVKYGFVTSPYPIIISAEIHCSLAGQDAIADIMCEVFGDKLVQGPIVREGRPDRLPSPEELKGRILLKTKNLDLSGKKESFSGRGEGEYGLTEMSASASSSTSDSDAVFEKQRKTSASHHRDSEAALTVKEFKDDLIKAGSTVLQRVRTVGKTSSSKATSGPNSSTFQPQNAAPRPVASLPATTSIKLPLSYIPPRGLTLSPGLIHSPSPSSLAPLPSIASALSNSPPSITRPPAGALTSSSAPVPIPPSSSSQKQKMSGRLLSLLVYTVGVKCRGINKKEVYAPEHMFSLSENSANRMLKMGGMQDLIKHCRTHLVRIYPKGTRVTSSNYEPHRYWSAGTQLVAINWQTFDLGYMINHAMFQRNGRTGYVLKPNALLGPTLPLSSLHHHRPHSPTSSSGPGSVVAPLKDLLLKRTRHHFDVSIISAQQLPRPKDSSGREIVDKILVDPFVEVSVHVPDWPSNIGAGMVPAPSSPARAHTCRTGVVKGNGFNPVWEEKLRIPFECVGDMRELVFIRFAVRASEKEDVEPLAVYCASLGSLGMGYRHLPLHDSQLSQYLFSTLFVRMSITDL
ncbi:hypothetical protein H0H92_009820 [Tricholoma furcatifolium]|nr:hypothetical protein H0H92_009820 [Tricholoma furcatifolium]